MKAFIDRTAATYGRLDVAFNNVGITVEKPLHEYSVEEWDRVIHTNQRSTFLAMKYEIPHMLKTGGGTIVVTAFRVALNRWLKGNASPIARLATAEEVAAFALTLASDEHPFTTGAQMVLDGGKMSKAG